LSARILARQGTSWYAYCAGNPVNAVDPTGRTGEGLAAFWAAFAAQLEKGGLVAFAGIGAVYLLISAVKAGLQVAGYEEPGAALGVVSALTVVVLAAAGLLLLPGGAAMATVLGAIASFALACILLMGEIKGAMDAFEPEGGWQPRGAL
jgi:hypothetical protein